MLPQYDTKRGLRIRDSRIQARSLWPILDAYYSHLRTVCLLIFGFIHNFISVREGAAYLHTLDFTSRIERFLAMGLRFQAAQRSRQYRVRIWAWHSSCFMGCIKIPRRSRLAGFRCHSRLGLWNDNMDVCHLPPCAIVSLILFHVAPYRCSASYPSHSFDGLWSQWRAACRDTSCCGTSILC